MRHFETFSFVSVRVHSRFKFISTAKMRGENRTFPALRRSAGFTLVEVLVSLAIFALSAVFLGSAYINVLNGYEFVSRGMQVNEDIAFARQQVLREPDRKKLEQGGDFETAGGRRVRWEVEIVATTMPNVFNVAFTCQIADPQREPEKIVQQFTVLRPTWVTDVAERDKLKEDVKARIHEIQGKQQQTMR
jgi:general secretion pathway protein I